MKLTVSHRKLSSIIAAVSRAAARKRGSDNLLFSYSKYNCTVEAAGEAIEIRLNLPVPETEESGEFLLPASLANSLLTATRRSQEDVTIDVGDKIRIQSGFSNYEINHQESSGIPRMRPIPDEDPPSFRIQSSDLSRIIRRTGFVFDDKSTKFSLPGLFLSYASDTLRVVGSSRGSQIVIASVPIQDAQVDYEHLSGIIPVTLSPHLSAIFQDGEAMVSVWLLSSTILFHSGPASLVSALMEGNPPPFEKVLQMPPTHQKFDITVDQLHDLFRGSMAITDKERPGVQFRSNGMHQLEVISESTIQGTAKSSCELDSEVPAIDVRIDPHMVTAFCGRMPRDELVTIQIASPPIEAMVFDIGDDYRYAVALME